VLKLRISSADRQEMGKKSKRRGVNAGKKSAVGASRSNGRCGGDETAIVADADSRALALPQAPSVSTNVTPITAAAAAEQLGSMSLGESVERKVAPEDTEKKDDEALAKLCSGCGKKSDTLKMCHGCQCVWYCDKNGADCLERHREEHEKECRRIKEVLDKRGGNLDVGTEIDIGPLEKLPPQEECLICRCTMPIYERLQMYYECCGNIVCRSCSTMHISKTGELNLKRSRDLEREVPPLPVVCPFCRITLRRSDEEVLSLLRKRVELKDPYATCELALLYGYGSRGLPVDQERCVVLLREAADLGCPRASSRLGSCHDFGEMGLEQNKDEACKHWKKAAEGGHFYAMFVHGNYVGLSGDHVAALRHFRLSAAGGHRGSMGTLMTCFFINGFLRHRDLAETLQAMYLARAEEKSEHRDEYNKLLKETGEYNDPYDM